MECRKYLKVLNGKTATATALILFNLGSAAIVCTSGCNRPYSVKRTSGIFAAMATIVPCM